MIPVLSLALEFFRGRRTVRGVLPVAMHLARTHPADGPEPMTLVVPSDNAGEAHVVSRLRSVAPRHWGAS